MGRRGGLRLTYRAKANKPSTSSQFSNSQPQMELREREKRETAERIYRFELHMVGEEGNTAQRLPHFTHPRGF